MSPLGEILVVDDEAVMLRLLRTILSQEGYTVRTADNATDALARGIDP
jgi:CheY-like chemotaxis protein